MDHSAIQHLFQEYSSRFGNFIRSLVAAEQRGMLAHAYLVYSDNEKIRNDFSLIVAAIASCPEADVESTPCLKCNVCRQIFEKTYPEMFFLKPVSKSRQITIGNDTDDPNTMRWFQDQFYMSKVCTGKRKIGIISEAECLNPNAQNCFLKTLEEPPKETIFVLNTGSPEALLPTIISRCQVLTLLENRCVYDFTGWDLICQTMLKLQSCTHNHLAVGEECVSDILAVSSNLSNQAEANIFDDWKDDLDNARNAVEEAEAKAARHFKGVQKLFQERYEAAKSAEYLRLRSNFLSLIHCWFAQIYQMACGAELQELANPEIFKHIDLKHSVPSPEKALQDLRKAERLCDNLNYNVNETLAFREFCCSFTA